MTRSDVLDLLIRSVPKAGRSGAENEDRIAFDADAGRFAVADGASTSARPEVWAGLLVEAFVDGLDPFSPDVLADLRRRWAAQVHAPDLPWYAEAKLRGGAHATLTGLRIDRAAGTYQALAVGDSCLLHLRARRLVRAIPLTASAQFSRFPQLIGSRWDSPAPEVVTVADEYQKGDCLLLATDAMAKYLIASAERHQRTPDVRRIAHADSEFVRGVATLRRRGLLDNDDTTLCVVTL